jgi:hypothetical protein
VTGVIHVRGCCWGHVPGVTIVTSRSRRCMGNMVAVNRGTGLGTLRALTRGLSSRGRRHLVPHMSSMGLMPHRRMIGMDAAVHSRMNDGLWRCRYCGPRVLGGRLCC